MAERSSETTVTFRHAFALSSIDGPIDPGTYRVVIDEEEILGLSFLAFRRVATLLHLPALAVSAQARQIVPVDQAELDAALARDATAS